MTSWLWAGGELRAIRGDGNRKGQGASGLSVCGGGPIAGREGVRVALRRSSEQGPQLAPS